MGSRLLLAAPHTPKLGFLWAIHAVHHEGEHFNLSLGVRNAWLSSLTSLPFFVPLALLGVTPEMFVAVSALHYSVQFYNHCGLVGRSGVLDRFMVTTANHRVHHGCNPEYIDRNFGGTLLLWDKLFGTYQRALADVPIRYGVHRPTHSDIRSGPTWCRHCNGWGCVRRSCNAIRVPRPRLDRHRGVLLFGVVVDYVRTDACGPNTGKRSGSPSSCCSRWRWAVCPTGAAGAAGFGRCWRSHSPC